MAIPSDIAGLRGWYKADAIVNLTQGGGNVGVWPDSSGNGFDAVQAAVGTLQPLYYPNNANGKPSVGFFYAGSQLVIPTAIFNTIGSAATVFIVQWAYGNNPTVFGCDDNSGGANRFLIQSNYVGTNYLDFGNISAGGRLSVGFAAAGGIQAFQMWSYRIGGGLMEMFRDGISQASSGGHTNSFNPAGQTIFMGSGNIGGMQGLFSEIIYYDRQLSDTERQSVEAYLRLKYFAPRTVAGLAGWYKADDISGISDGAALHTWPDSSGNGYDIANSWMPTDPTYHQNVLNGFAVARFPGNSGLSTWPATPNIAEPYTMFFVANAVKPASGQAAMFICNGGNTASVTLWLTSDGRYTLYDFSASAGIFTGALGDPDYVDYTGAFHIFTAIVNGASSALYVNGQQVALRTQAQPPFPPGIVLDNFFIGATDYQASYPYSLIGDIAEIAIYSGALSTTDRQTVENYLRDKYLPPKTIRPAYGAYALAGEPVNFPRTRILAAGRGAYALVGRTVNLLYSHVAGLTQGAYALTGNALAFVRGEYIRLVTGKYNLVGSDVGMLENKMYFDTGQYFGLGFPPTMTWKKLLPPGPPPLPPPGTRLRAGHLLDLCTPSINYDAQVQSSCYAFDQQMYEVIDDTGQVVFIPNILGLTDSKLVDILAWQFHVDFYDATRSLAFRKNLVQMSIEWHRTKGTVKLVEDVINTYWVNGGATLQEWWTYYDPLPPNYPTEPGWHDRYRFRVAVDGNYIPPEDENAVLALIDKYKPISRWCDGIVRPVVSICDIGWCGMVLRFISKESAKPTNYP